MKKLGIECIVPYRAAEEKKLNARAAGMRSGRWIFKKKYVEWNRLKWRTFGST
jgi:hypothetical protein